MQDPVPLGTQVFCVLLNPYGALPDPEAPVFHGTAYDIAGKGIADETSFRAAIYKCIDLINMRREYADQYKNPLKKMSASVVANAVDEKISDEAE